MSQIKGPLLGDEAVAQAAIDAGITAAYAYPGTPSTEILETLIHHFEKTGAPRATWCANEKTAYEQALGVSLVGRRALVAMKHVGLNVAADAFVNSALVDINGGLVLVVADDPGMHSSQNEQDSRYLADFAHTLCLEPADQQQAYDMTREAFELSEKYQIPVMIRLVTRLAHSRTDITTQAEKPQNPLKKVQNPASWILVPANAKKQWHKLVELQPELQNYSEQCPYQQLKLSEQAGGLGVITTGMARGYFLENAPELGSSVSHLHIGAYPMPVGLIRKLVQHVSRVIVLEDGFPYVERLLRGIIPPAIEIHGKLSGHVPLEGELSPDSIRPALGLRPRTGLSLEGFKLSSRPPQLCAGCPHADSFNGLTEALREFGAHRLITSDIGCYALGSTPPHYTGETCVCMGASVGLAKGAADAGFYPVVSLIGDSTFLHSGMTPLLDAVAANSDMTLIILDNMAIAMTGGQPELVPSSRLREIVLGIGVPPDHVHVVDASRKNTAANAALVKKEVAHRGLSVIIAVRECIETAKRHKGIS
ncbi:thiamine pyrophosphate-dependent enzyme [Bdellovibrionota bacterium FG-1]